MTAFERAWDLVKFRIPNISERAHRERDKEDWQQANVSHLWSGHEDDRIDPFPESEKPENWGSKPTFQGQDFQHSAWKQPSATGISTDQGTSYVNVGAILSQILGWPQFEKIPLDFGEGDEGVMTDERIEDAIRQILSTSKHESIHDIQNVIFPYEGYHRYSDDDGAFRRNQVAQEYGAHAGEYDTRMGALRGMSRHPHFSEGGWDDEYAPERNPHRNRLFELWRSTQDAREGMSREEGEAFMEQYLAELQGKRARENAAARGGTVEEMP